METVAENKIGICLSGGGALGYAHIGVLQALTENNIHPQIISGSSMGAIIGVLYANNITPEHMLELVRNEKMYKISTLLNPSFAQYGLSSHKMLKKLLNETVPHEFESLKKEFYVCASNVNKAEWEIVGTGNQLHEYVIASASIPFLFESVLINSHTFVDGGLYNNVPSQALHRKCATIIGVDVLPYFEKKKINRTNELLILSIRGVMHHNSLSGRKLCNFLIEPPSIQKYNEFSFDKFEEIYKLGYDTTIKYIAENPSFAELANIKI